MRILILTPSLSQGGGVTNYYNTLRMDDQVGIEYFSVNKENSVSLIGKFYFSIYIYFSFILKARKYELIHINPSLNFKSFYRDMIFIALSRLLNKKILIFFRGWEDSFQRKIQSSKFSTSLFLHTYGKADHYIVLSEKFRKKLMLLGVNSEKPFHIETTVAGDSLENSFSIEEKINSANENINCLFISRILKEKGIYIAIDAFIKCKQNTPDQRMTLYIAGEGDELSPAQDYVKANKYSDIHFVGQVTGSQKIELLKKCHIMIFPTYYGEGLPNCILEGMLYGMPIISRINAGIPDIVKHELNGYLTESIDKDVFTNFLMEIATNKSIYQSMALENFKKAHLRFTTEKVKNRLLNIYQQTLK